MKSVDSRTFVLLCTLVAVSSRTLSAIKGTQLCALACKQLAGMQQPAFYQVRRQGPRQAAAAP